MEPIVLYCCSYARDVGRAVRMAQSVAHQVRVLATRDRRGRGGAYQSNWETWTDYGTPRKSLPSRMARTVKRAVKRILVSSARAP
jgi:hypothetical protein